MTWRVPECPFAIEWSAAVMEEIREAAMDAFFSLRHGGAEIGGVLLGTRRAGRVSILSARPLECEHALGPTFTLSERDYARLAELLADAHGWEPVGWYHSHTRSEIFLSDRDLEIHNRFFPDPWQIALVVRPHAMQPMRAGFFFREANGSIHADCSYSEFEVQPAPGAVAVQPAPPAVVQRPAPQAVAMQPASPVSPASASRPAPPAPHSRRWLVWVAIMLGVAAGPLVFKNGWARVFAAGRPASASLMAYDLNGQLQIHWDWAADPIRSAEAGTLEIKDGATRTVVALAKGQLQGGTLSYTRIGARVDVRLTLREPGGKAYEEFTSFLGQADRLPPDASVAALRRELLGQTGRMQELEKAVAGLRSTVKSGQERGQRRLDAPVRARPPGRARQGAILNTTPQP